MTESKKTYNKKVSGKDKNQAGTSDLIRKKTLEIVNERGMVEFRVDILSSLLGLSPGNVTYHFARKEDLCYSLWTEFMDEFKALNVLISDLMDIKQSFLVFRSISHIICKYRGIVMYRGGDILLNKKDNDSEFSLTKTLRECIRVMMKHLYDNGYIREDYKENRQDEIVEDNTTTLMRYWVNKEYVFDGEDAGDLAGVIDTNAIMMLYSLYPILNEHGAEEFVKLKEKLL